MLIAATTARVSEQLFQSEKFTAYNFYFVKSPSYLSRRFLWLLRQDLTHLKISIPREGSGFIAGTNCPKSLFLWEALELDVFA